jgi:hypothetical protein
MMDELKITPSLPVEEEESHSPLLDRGSFPKQLAKSRGGRPAEEEDEMPHWSHMRSAVFCLLCALLAGLIFILIVEETNAGQPNDLISETFSPVCRR